MTSTTKLPDVAEIRQVVVQSTAHNEADANRLLAEGWILLSAATTPGDIETSSYSTLLLGRPATANARSAA